MLHKKTAQFLDGFCFQVAFFSLPKTKKRTISRPFLFQSNHHKIPLF
ncbi:MAG: hypothetical protein J6V99_01395 [Neisseriaceae bacterium]|nr:hypothetical protein [Neisseriaceae bacterium]